MKILSRGGAVLCSVLALVFFLTSLTQGGQEQIVTMLHAIYQLVGVVILSNIADRYD